MTSRSEVHHANHYTIEASYKKGQIFYVEVYNVLLFCEVKIKMHVTYNEWILVFRTVIGSLRLALFCAIFQFYLVAKNLHQKLSKIGSLLRKSGLAIQFLLKFCYRNHKQNIKMVRYLRVQVLVLAATKSQMELTANMFTEHCSQHNPVMFYQSQMQKTQIIFLKGFQLIVEFLHWRPRPFSLSKATPLMLAKKTQS